MSFLKNIDDRKTVDAIKLVAMGLQPQEALQITNHKPKITSEAVRKFNRKFDKYSLVKPDLVKLARNAVKDVLDNKPINGDIYPTHSNKLAAASMVYDRFEPVKSNQEATTINNTFIDLSHYKTDNTSKDTQNKDNIIDV